MQMQIQMLMLMLMQMQRKMQMQMQMQNNANANANANTNTNANANANAYAHTNANAHAHPHTNANANPNGNTNTNNNNNNNTTTTTNNNNKDEQKGCRKGSRGTKDQLLIDKAILKNCRRRLTNLSMPCIDFKKAYDMVPHSWILKCLDMAGAAKNIISTISNSMVNWKIVLTSGGTVLGQVDIKRGIFKVTPCHHYCL